MGLKKQIIQLKEGKKVAIYESATEAAKAIGSTKGNISKCCNGKLNSVNGYTFEYTGKLTNKQEDKGDFCCPYCDRHFETYNGLCKHVFSNKKLHGEISQEKLLIDFKYNGIRPKCKCGCGEYTDISYVGGAHFCDYIQGHQSRVNNNWGHNESAKLHSSETRRKQFKSGERKQWNKGKKWKETYSEEKISELIKIYTDEERNRKIRAALKGVPKSEEHKNNIKKAFNTDEYRKMCSENMFQRLISGEFSLSSKIEKEFIEKCIKPLGIDFNTQYYIKDLHHYCDVYIPSKNTIIEFQGDYWHGNPKKYEKEGLSEYQLKKVEKDKILREYCKNNGIKLIEVWESDYNKNNEKITEMLSESVNNS